MVNPVKEGIVMKVKEFDSYRAPRRKPWGAIIAVLLLGVGTYWFFIREKPERPPREKQEQEQSVTLQSPDPAGAKSGGTEQTTPAPANVLMLMDTAAQLAAAQKFVEARASYLEALQLTDHPALRREIESKLAAVNITLLLSPRPMPEKVDYVIKRGDSLGLIANRFGTTTELIQAINMISNPNLIRQGQRLLVFTGKFELVANKTTHDMVVLMNGQFFKRYKVGTGVSGKTPVGTFVVREKIAEPTWWPPDGREVPFGHPDNILGTRWMSVRATGDTPDVRGYGIHGTWEPGSVGKASSAGCLRMINAEVQELFTYIPVGTPLRIDE
jgi:LysM repeat protein